MAVTTHFLLGVLITKRPLPEYQADRLDDVVPDIGASEGSEAFLHPSALLRYAMH